MYRRALEGKEKAWGPEHTSTLIIVNNITSTLDMVNNLAIHYKYQCKLEEAEAIYRVSALPQPWLLEISSSYGGLTLVSSANRLPIEQVACHFSNSCGPIIENNTRTLRKERLEELESDSNIMQDIE